MKTAYWIGAAIVAIILIVLVVKMVGSSSTSTTDMTASSTEQVQTNDSNSTAVPGQGSAAATTSSSASAPSTGAAAAPAAQHFTVNGNDATADLKTITVPAGTPVTITFGADAGTTYHGGLDFRSSVLNTGTITPGSTKTVSFTATKSFSFTPYWPATNIAKPYTIDIVVR